jgi:hypothetical protein
MGSYLGHNQRIANKGGGGHAKHWPQQVTDTYRKPTRDAGSGPQLGQYLTLPPAHTGTGYGSRDTGRVVEDKDMPP